MENMKVVKVEEFLACKYLDTISEHLNAGFKVVPTDEEFLGCYVKNSDGSVRKISLNCTDGEECTYVVHYESVDSLINQAKSEIEWIIDNARDTYKKSLDLHTFVSNMNNDSNYALLNNDLMLSHLRFEKSKVCNMERFLYARLESVHRYEENAEVYENAEIALESLSDLNNNIDKLIDSLSEN